jgi:hypothetical protein
MRRTGRSAFALFGLAALLALAAVTTTRAAVSRDEVERAIRDGVRYLKLQQRDDGSWPDVDEAAHTGTTSLVTLALLTAGEPINSPTITKALGYLREFGPDQLKSTYSVALQTMVFATAEPERDQLKLAINVDWLEKAQIKANDRVPSPGSWTYTSIKNRHGDNSNTQYALLGLNSASEAGIPVKPEVWVLARRYWEDYQRGDGSWAYTPEASSPPTASMTCAGISSLVITGLKRFQGQESLTGDTIQNCGKGGVNIKLQRAIDWMAGHFRVGENFGHGQQWKYYYLYGLERAGRLTGQRFFGGHDWYRAGATELVRLQNPVSGAWAGTEGYEAATSFGVLFLAKGRSPVLVNKLRHDPGRDWNNDLDDVRNLVEMVSRDWKHLLTWQVVDPNFATIEDLLQAPIAFINGHEAPVLSAEGKRKLRDYVEQGGLILADACCGREEFDRGFRQLVKEIFPEPEYELRALAEEHPVWRAKYRLDPESYTLLGIDHGCRTVLIYSPDDLSCYWNQAESEPNNPLVSKALKLGQNIVDYATGRELPADKLAVREIHRIAVEAPKRGALQIAKLRHAGDWNIAPLAIPNLTTALRDKLKFDVVINHKELFPRDPSLVHYPLIYLHGRAAVDFSDEDRDALRRHLDPGGGTLFADAACGSPAFDAAFRKFVAELMPKSPLIPIPKHDDFYTRKLGYDLSDARRTPAAGGKADFPDLEGVQVDGRWAIIYSKLDLGCALQKQAGIECKGYTHETALRIATNIVLYATLP